MATGVCYTDSVATKLGLTPFLLVLGHQIAGIVEKVGALVEEIEQGDHVVIFYTSCGYCQNCRAGHPSICMDYNLLNIDGGNWGQGKKMHEVIEGDGVQRRFIPQFVEYFKKDLFPFDKLAELYDFQEINQTSGDSNTVPTMKLVLMNRETTK
nr:alcohol dehydrogenase catalytic domain-containing protein [Brevibacillus sp. M2.1A]